MPYPKISATLNNCALHSMTPEIKEQVAHFAGNPNYDNHNNLEYNKLKDTFAQFYGLEKESFTWQKFNQILQSYNPYDTQIILGPVLREFMKEPLIDSAQQAERALLQYIANESENIEVLKVVAESSNDPKDIQKYKDRVKDLEIAVEHRNTYIEQLRKASELQQNGRYRSISTQEAFNHVGNRLGISIQTKKEGNEVEQPFIAHHPVALISLFHQGNSVENGNNGADHWERTNDPLDRTDFSEERTTKLQNIASLFSHARPISEEGLDLLKNHVRSNLSPQALSLQENLSLTARQIDQFLINVNAVSKPLATRLLGPHLTENARRFIDEFQAQEPNDKLYERHVNAFFRGQTLPPVNDQSIQPVIDSLLKQASQVQAQQNGPVQQAPERRFERHETILKEAVIHATTSGMLPEHSKNKVKFMEFKKLVSDLVDNHEKIMKEAKNPSSGLSEDQKLAYKLQAEEFEKQGFKPKF